ncbi:Ser-Thr-rich glycosyl-phosphatidyl-inositol-anchored membrane family protein [compost metagenome]
MTRTFPSFAILRSGIISGRGHRLSNVARSYNFKFIAREVKDGWGAVNVSDQNNNINVIATPRPFAIIYPNTNDSIIKNSATTIYWDQAHTGSAPINCSTVNIYLSVDTGRTYPIVLAQNVPNTGSALVNIPDIASTTARVKVKASNNIFFSVSRRNVVIGNTATAVPTIDTGGTTAIKELAAEEGISIYPNPATDQVTVSLNKEAGNGTIQLMNMLGQTIWTEGLSRQQASRTVPVGHLSKGVYYIRFVNTAGAVYNQKLVLK